MKILRCADLIEVPWKNGGGTTRGIATALKDDALAWRLSRADVAQDGAFSNFSGLVRILTVVSGTGMTLNHPDGALVAKPWQPVRFDGGLEVSSRLDAGPLTDLNLMFDPTHCDGTALSRQGPYVQKFTPPQPGVIAFHVLAGTPRIGASDLAVGDTAILDTPSTLALAQGDAVVEIGIRYLDHGAAIRLCMADR